METFVRIPDSRSMRSSYRTDLKGELVQATRHPRTRWHISLPVGVSILLVASGGAVAGAVVYEHFRPVTNFNTAHCYSLPTEGTSGTTIAVAGPLGSPNQVTNAIATCGMLWQDGFLQAGVSQIVRVTVATTLHQIPNLVECTMPDGTDGVFPGPATLCKTLGLPSPTP
jgi:hypothetical protein